MGSPPQKHLQKFKIWPKIERVRLDNFAASGSSLTKLFQTMCCEGGVIMWVPFLEGQPQKFGMAKKRPNFGAISDNLRIDREYLRNGSTYRTAEKKLDKPQPVGGKKLDELWSTIKTVLEVHTDPHKWTFCGRLHFGP